MRDSRDRMGGVELPIQCVRVHDADDDERLAALAAGGGVPTLRSLAPEASFGVNDAGVALRLIETYGSDAFDSIMLAGCWNLLDQSGEQVLRVCEKAGIRVHIAGVFGAGIVSWKDWFAVSGPAVSITLKNEQHSCGAVISIATKERQTM